MQCNAFGPDSLQKGCVCNECNERKTWPDFTRPWAPGRVSSVLQRRRRSPGSGHSRPIRALMSSQEEHKGMPPGEGACPCALPGCSLKLEPEGVGQILEIFAAAEGRSKPFPVPRAGEAGPGLLFVAFVAHTPPLQRIRPECIALQPYATI